MLCADLEGTPLTLVGLWADATMHLYKYRGKQATC